MSLTRDSKETIQPRIERDPTFREELSKKGLNAYSPAKWTPASPFQVYPALLLCAGAAFW